MRTLLHFPGTSGVFGPYAFTRDHTWVAYLSAIKVTFNEASLADTATTLIIKPYITVGGAKIYGDACAIVIVKDGGVVTVADHYVM